MPELIRSLTPADLPRADAVLNAAYGPGARLERLRRYMTIEPNGWFAALSDDALVGLGGAVNYGAFAYLGLMAVHPEAQRRGLGRRITQRILQWVSDSGCGCVLLDASAAGAPLYASMGFVEDEKTVLLRRAVLATVAATVASVNTTVALFHARDLPDIAAFDAPLFGARRDKVLSDYLAEFGERTWVARDGAGAVTGYAIAQHSVIGPWVATSAAGAESLLNAALGVPFSDGPLVMIPSTNVSGIALVKRFGFAEVRELSHMRHGGDRSPGDRRSLYGRASFAVG